MCRASSWPGSKPAVLLKSITMLYIIGSFAHESMGYINWKGARTLLNVKQGVIKSPLGNSLHKDHHLLGRFLCTPYELDAAVQHPHTVLVVSKLAIFFFAFSCSNLKMLRFFFNWTFYFFVNCMTNITGQIELRGSHASVSVQLSPLPCEAHTGRSSHCIFLLMSESADYDLFSVLIALEALRLKKFLHE